MENVQLKSTKSERVFASLAADPNKRLKIMSRLCAKRRLTSSGCVEWTGPVTKKGYGTVTVGHETMTVHRVAQYLATGIAIPSHMAVCHRCDNPSCFNPEHLFVGTFADNNRDMIAKGRGRNGQGAPKLTDAQVAEIRARSSSGESKPALSAAYQTSYHTIRDILRGKRRVFAAPAKETEKQS